MNKYNYLTMMILGKHYANYRELTLLINNSQGKQPEHLSIPLHTLAVYAGLQK